MRRDPKDGDLKNLEPEVSLIGFELADCEVKLDAGSVKYLRAVHRTALELAIPNRFGLEAGGFWLTNEQIEQLRRLPDYYPPGESAAVAQTIEAYLKAQLKGFYSATLEGGSTDH
jgi:hypothetical protein